MDDDDDDDLLSIMQAVHKITIKITIFTSKTKNNLLLGPIEEIYI